MSSRYSLSPLAAISHVIRSRELISQLARREVAGRYRGSFAGLLWSFLNPLLSLAMYTFVFGVVFNARWGLQAENTIDFALILFAGLIVHGLLAECIGRAPYLVIGNPNYVKQVVFPIEILPVVALCSSLFHVTISTGLLLLIWGLSHGGLPAAALAIPFLLFPLCLIALGASWFLSAFTVFFRDMAQIVNFVSAGLLFLSPVFYPADRVPEPFRTLLQFNPLTFVIESVRGSLVTGNIPDPLHYLIYLAISIGVACIGYAWFQKTRPGFADVI